MPVNFDVISSPYSLTLDDLANKIAYRLAGLLGDGWEVTDLNPTSGTLQVYERLTNPNYHTTFEVVWNNNTGLWSSMQIYAYYQGYRWTNGSAYQDVGSGTVSPSTSKYTIAVFKNNNGDFAIKFYDGDVSIIAFTNLIVKDPRGKDVFLAAYLASDTLINYAFEGSRGFKTYTMKITKDMQNSGVEIISRANDALWGGYLSDVYQITNYQTVASGDTQTVNGVSYRLIGGGYQSDRGKGLLAVPSD